MNEEEWYSDDPVMLNVSVVGWKHSVGEDRKEGGREYLSIYGSVNRVEMLTEGGQLRSQWPPLTLTLETDSNALRQNEDPDYLGHSSRMRAVTWEIPQVVFRLRLSVAVFSAIRKQFYETVSQKVNMIVFTPDLALCGDGSVLRWNCQKRERLRVTAISVSIEHGEIPET